MPKAMWIAVTLNDGGYRVILPDGIEIGRYPQAAMAVAKAEACCEVLNASAAGLAEWMVDVCDSTAVAMGFTRA